MQRCSYDVHEEAAKALATTLVNRMRTAGCTNAAMSSA